MSEFPEYINNEEELEELLSRPSGEVVSLIRDLEGDFLFLGVAGKIGPSIARMAKRASAMAGVSKKILGVSRFSSGNERQKLENYGIETIRGDLLDPDFIRRLPQIRNVIYLAGMKFGSDANLPLTWAMNTLVPALVADKFRDSRIVAFSTGCVYPLVPVDSGGSRETDPAGAYGEYAQSCLGRERMFEYGSQRNNTPVSLIRLNYAVELRYGVLVDIALRVWNDEPVDLSMGYFNVIWQGDMNNMALRMLDHCTSPAGIINLTGPEILSARKVALEFGKLWGKTPGFTGTEASTALLSNAGFSHQLFGKPGVTPERMIPWIANWVSNGKKLLNKRTHYEVRDGKY